MYEGYSRLQVLKDLFEAGSSLVYWFGDLDLYVPERGVSDRELIEAHRNLMEGNDE